jgi:hypothetical protein
MPISILSFKFIEVACRMREQGWRGPQSSRHAQLGSSGATMPERQLGWSQFPPYCQPVNEAGAGAASHRQGS